MTEAAPQPMTTVGIARQLAATHPAASLPCPICAASLGAANLDRHLAKVHPAYAQAAGPGSEPLRVRGADRRMIVPAIALLIVWAAVAMVGITISGGQAEVLPTAIVGGAGLLVLGLAGIASAGLFKATLELNGDHLRLRWLFGLASVRVRLPAKLEAGTLTKRQISNISQDNVNVATDEVRAGAYLRLRGGATITVGAAAAGLGKRWAQRGWAQGKKTGRSDIDIDRAALVALEYQLAARGQLTPKSA